MFGGTDSIQSHIILLWILLMLCGGGVDMLVIEVVTFDKLDVSRGAKR
jgi:hypothetical protein